MSRSNIDKPFFVDVGTSIAAVRCQSNRDVLDRFDHVRLGKAGIEMAKKMCDRMNAEVDKFVAAKDSMISEQSAVNESQAAQLRDALNECEELKCAIADLKHISDAVVKSLRDKKLEMSGEIAEKDAEIEKLRALVGELADALENYPCHNCKHGSERCEWCGKAKELGALVAKAREMASEASKKM